MLCNLRSFVWALVMIHQLTCIQASAVLLEVGNNDPGNCETLGEHLMMKRYCCTGVDTFTPSFVIAGVTKSKTMVTGSSTASGCLEKAVAFWQFYHQPTDNNLSLIFTRIYNDVVTLNGEIGYFGSVAALAQRYWYINQLVHRFCIMIKLYRYTDGVHIGTLVDERDYLLTDQGSWCMKFFNSSVVLPEPKTFVIDAGGNTWAQNFRNSPTPVFRAFLFDQRNYMFLKEFGFPTKVGITSIISEAYISIFAVGRHINDDVTKGVQIYFYMDLNLQIIKETYKIVSADNDEPSWFVDSMHHDDFR